MCAGTSLFIGDQQLETSSAQQKKLQCHIHSLEGYSFILVTLRRALFQL